MGRGVQNRATLRGGVVKSCGTWRGVLQSPGHILTPFFLQIPLENHCPLISANEVDSVWYENTTFLIFRFVLSTAIKLTDTINYFIHHPPSQGLSANDLLWVVNKEEILAKRNPNHWALLCVHNASLCEADSMCKLLNRNIGGCWSWQCDDKIRR